MMDYETFIKTNFTDQVTIENPDIHFIQKTAPIEKKADVSFFVHEPPAPEKVKPAATEAFPLDPGFMEAQKQQAFADYTQNVRKLTLSLEKQKQLYRERSQHLKKQLDAQLETLNLQANRARIELRQQIMAQRSEHAHQIEAYEKAFIAEKSELIKRHTEEITRLNKQFHQDFINKESESRQHLQHLESEYGQQAKEIQSKIRGLSQQYDSEHQKIRQQYEPIIQSEQAHYQRLLQEIKEKRDKLVNDFEAQRRSLKDHYEPLLASDKEQYRKLLSSLIAQKEQFIAELGTL